ncbi:MAG: DUF2927 domain-containing protein [Alphaproteobacteria bacterium]
MSPWVRGLFVTCALILGAPPAHAENGGAIRLQSDDEADACIADLDCMRRLFLEATVGTQQATQERLLKWTDPMRVTIFGGHNLKDEVHARTSQLLQQANLLGKAAGVDIGPSGPEDVVNFLVLVSGDFDGDRNGAFAELFETVFAGRPELYDELAAGDGPVCSHRGFVEGKTRIGGGVLMAQVQPDREAFDRCVLRAMLESLGLRYPLGATTDSLLNPKTARAAWTSIDFLLLRMLYDPSMRPGMSRDEIAAAFPKAYQALTQPAG